MPVFINALMEMMAPISLWYLPFRVTVIVVPSLHHSSICPQKLQTSPSHTQVARVGTLPLQYFVAVRSYCSRAVRITCSGGARTALTAARIQGFTASAFSCCTSALSLGKMTGMPIRSRNR